MISLFVQQKEINLLTTYKERRMFNYEKELVKTVSSSFNKMGFQLKKHSPEILVVAGVVGTVVSAVMACKATTKVSEILENSKNVIDSIHDCQANEAMADQYTPEDAKKIWLSFIFRQDLNLLSFMLRQ